MKRNNLSWLRLWLGALALLVLAAGYLIASVNPFDTSLIFLALVVAVVFTGLLTNFWGGLAASAVAVFAGVLINQYMGIYSSQNALVNVASELGLLLLAGLAAGGSAESMERANRKLEETKALAEKRSIHDETFSTLRPEWGKIRLEEEILRARRFSRPLALALLELEAHKAGDSIPPMQAMIRICRSACGVAAVVAYAGQQRVMLILPEHGPSQAQDLLKQIEARAEQEVYFPKNEKGLGKPLREWGRLRAGLAFLEPEGNAALLEDAAAALEKH